MKSFVRCKRSWPILNGQIDRHIKADSSLSTASGSTIWIGAETGIPRSAKEECLSKLILFGESSLRQVLSQYVDHFHGERNHQGKGNVILSPMPADRIGESTGEIQTRARLGGLLKFYYRQAA